METGDHMTQFLESNCMKRGGMAVGAYNGKVLGNLTLSYTG